MIDGTDALGDPAAHVFARVGSTWDPRAVLPGPGITISFFVTPPRVFDVRGDTLAIGVPNPPDEETGRVDVYVRDGTSWSLETQLRAPDGEPNDRFGESVSLAGADGSRLAIGAPRVDRNGAVYLFTRHQGTWVAERTLRDCVDSLGVRMGVAVALLEDQVLAGTTVPDAAGEVGVYDLDDPYASFCDAGDGALASCPCANPGAPDSGCDVPQATGGVRLDVVAQAFAPENRATLVADGFPPAGTPASVVLRSRTLEAGGPVAFGDGLRCVGTPVVRVGAGFALGGSTSFVLGHGADSGPYHYQVWLRSLPASFCTPGAFNLSNGRTLSW